MPKPFHTYFILQLLNNLYSIVFKYSSYFSSVINLSISSGLDSSILKIQPRKKKGKITEWFNQFKFLLKLTLQTCTFEELKNNLIMLFTVERDLLDITLTTSTATACAEIAKNIEINFINFFLNYLCHSRIHSQDSGCLPMLYLLPLQSH